MREFISIELKETGIISMAECDIIYNVLTGKTDVSYDYFFGLFLALI